MAFKLLALVPTLVASHSPIGTNGEKFRGSSHSRKLWNLAAQENHIWGKCDDWDAKVSGCQLNSDYKCNAYNSQGPQEYDMEITLGNLTPSRPGNPVHLQWWAPRKSQTAWNPHVNLAGCAVYGWMNRAYPKYSDSDFNGGNQEVGTDGTVKIRFQAPATYFVTHWISVPHVHLRVCSNDTFAHTTQDAIVFVDKGPELVAGEGGSTMEILKVQNFSHTNSPGSGSVTDPYILGLLVWKKDKQVGMTTTPLPGGLIEEVIDEEMAKMNWDALEFSPIYQCFMEEKLFDHFTAQCTTSCGGDAEVARGQCVRRASDETVEAVATWKVEATCNEVCWSEWKNKTLHYTRLAIADMLDIPFQEVRKAAVTFHNGSPGNGRRLAERWATVQAYVNTRRLTLTEINSLLPEVFATPAEATAIMNFPVTSVQITRLANDNQWPTMALSASEITDYVDSGNDPFEGAYNEREPTGGLQTIGGIPTSGLPVGLVVGVAVALLVFGFAIGFCFYWRRRKAITQLGGGDRVVTAAGTVIRGDAASLGKKVEDNGVPATANHSPQDLARKAQDPW